VRPLAADVALKSLTTVPIAVIVRTATNHLPKRMEPTFCPEREVQVVSQTPDNFPGLRQIWAISLEWARAGQWDRR
jgi:hypothetical protein